MVSLSNVTSSIFGGLSADFKKKNFSLYGQWIGFMSIFVCIGVGISNIIQVSFVIVFSIICVVQGFIIVFVEMPFLLKICPFTDTFIKFIGNFDENWPRCGFYLLNAVIQWVSLAVKVTVLIIPAIFLTVAAACYLLAALKHQEFLKTELNLGDPDSIEGQVGAHVVRGAL